MFEQIEWKTRDIKI